MTILKPRRLRAQKGPSCNEITMTDSAVDPSDPPDEPAAAARRVTDPVTPAGADEPAFSYRDPVTGA